MTHRAEALNEFLNRLTAAGMDGTRLDADDRARLETYLGEVRIGHELVAPVLEPGQRILEIGSGIGALGHFLAGQGADIRGLEPAGSGFDAMTRLAGFVAASCGETGFTIAPRRAEDLHPARDGLFDLIFSVHVLEHLEDPETALAAMASVLKPGGQMVHLCPNYRFPYDPHFAIPLPFWSPALAQRVYGRRIRQHQGVWDSLNFIGAGRLKRIARRAGLGAAFHPGVMRAAFRRLNDDAVFRARHSGLAGRAAAWLAGGPLIGLVGALPPEWASPMAVTFRKAA